MAKLELTYFCDVLCVWAYAAQIRVDEVIENFNDSVVIKYRFCSVFGDCATKIETGWANQGGYAGFGKHVQEVGEKFDHIHLHPDLWSKIRPTTSASSHLLLRAAAREDPDLLPPLLTAIREAFFLQGRDISASRVQREVLEELGIEVARVEKWIENGQAFADLETDQQQKLDLKAQGSPCFSLNAGRQTLFGNVGYRVIEANIRELLRNPMPDQASWC